MTLERWTAFVGVLLVVVFTPGPDFAVVLRHALARPARGVRAAAGNVTGLAAHTAAAALGLSALLAARPDVLTVIRIAGAAYLVWLAVQALRSAFGRDAAAGRPARSRSPHPYLDGLATNLLNAGPRWRSGRASRGAVSMIRSQARSSRRRCCSSWG